MPSLRVRSGKQGEVQHRNWADCHVAPPQLAILPWESARLPTAPAFPAMNLPVQPIPLTTVRCGDSACCFSFGGESAAHTRPAFRLAFPLHRSGRGLRDEGQTPGQHAVSAGMRSILPPSGFLGLHCAPGLGVACWASLQGSWVPLTTTKWKSFCPGPAYLKKVGFNCKGKKQP